MSPADWKQAWGEGRLIALQFDGHMLPLESERFLKSYGMPQVMVFECDVDFEIQFAPLTTGLVSYNTLIQWGDFYDADRDRAWGSQFVIAYEEFCNGRASHCVDGSRGIVTRIDVELDRPESFVNSSVATFAEALLAVATWASEIKSSGKPPSRGMVDSLDNRFRLIDSAVFEEANSYWPKVMKLIAKLTGHEGEIKPWEITSDPAKSKPRF